MRTRWLSWCVLTATGDEPWLTVSKAAIPPAPPVPGDVDMHLRTPVTDPEREPAFAADFDDQFADDPGEAARLRARFLQRGTTFASFLPARTKGVAMSC